MYASLLLLCASLTLAAFVASAQPDPEQYGADEMAQPVGLPPISRAEVHMVLTRAEAAAIHQALGGPATPNPFPARTRAHVLWEGHYGSTLLAWEEC